MKITYYKCVDYLWDVLYYYLAKNDMNEVKRWLSEDVESSIKYFLRGKENNILTSVVVERFFYEVFVYGVRPKFTHKIKFLSGDDGTLKYFYICKKCKTIIVDDHSREDLVDASVICPVCEIPKKFHMTFYKKGTSAWKFHYSYFSGLNLLRLRWSQYKSEFKYKLENLLWRIKKWRKKH